MKLITEPTPTTLQGVFDRAWAWANKPDFKRCSEGTGIALICKYRSEDNTNACLIGCCIPDSEYSKEMESMSVGAFSSYEFEAFEGINEEALAMLQLCHDNAFDENNVISKLEIFAATHNLKL